ncbi:MAG: hypothetical protein WKF97_01350 [Chitinophagaceae bacterium]
MSTCSFTIDFRIPPELLINKTRTAIDNQGGAFDGDIASGTFTVQVLGSIAGSYTISGQRMNIEISNKPMFISCSQIESFMKNQFGS